jgi:exodeoxyribonuclease V alpha subunit
MATHLSARLAWHMDGWNGHICRNPSSNRHCIGPHSFPGDEIKQRRDLAWETTVAGKPCSTIDGIPPCIYSINAFGADTLTGAKEGPREYAYLKAVHDAERCIEPDKGSSRIRGRESFCSP